MISFDKIHDKGKIDKFSNYILIHKGKREATDGAKVGLRIVNTILSIKIKVQCLLGSFAFA